MTTNILIIFGGVLLHCILTINAGCSNDNEVKSKSAGKENAPLHHIIEFKKRDEVNRKDCERRNQTKANSTKLPSVLGLHGLLHVRSQKVKQQTGTRREDEPDNPDAVIIKRPHDEGGIKRMDEEEKQLRKLQLRAETISMLHKIVEKYFPGGHLTVEQKIKSLKILGKLIKLKKEGKTSAIKAILHSLPTKGQESTNITTARKLLLKKKNGGKTGNKIPINKAVKDDDGGSDGKDLYATIANGPDVPKLPPSISGKDPDHAHSNIMPVGVGGEGDPMTSMGHGHDIGDDFDSYHSPYSNYQNPSGSLGGGQIFNTGDSYYGDKVSMGSLPMMDVSPFARSRMPLSPGYHHEDHFDEDGDERDRDDDYDDEDSNDDDEDNEDDPEETRSYVHRHESDDDDGDDDDDEYSNRFDRKDKIAKGPRKNHTAMKSGKDLNKYEKST